MFLGKDGAKVSEKVMKEVMVSDEDHVWIDGRQLISLKQTGAEELASTLEKLSEVAEDKSIVDSAVSL